MVTLLAIIQLLLIIIICYFEYKWKSITLFLWATLLIMFGLPHFFSILFDSVHYSSAVLNGASVFVSLFSLLYIITKYISIRFLHIKNNGVEDLNEKINEYKDNGVVRKFLNIMFYTLIGCIITYYLYAEKYLGGIGNSSWGSYLDLNRELGLNSAIRYAGILYNATSGVLLLLYIFDMKIKALVSFIILCLVPLITGQRSSVLPILLIFIVYVIYNTKSNIKLKNIIILSVLGLISLYIVYFLRTVRFQGTLNALFSDANFWELHEQTIDMLLNGDGELGLRKIFYYFIQNNNQFPNFNKAHTYIRLLLIAVPTSLSFGLKPLAFDISMGQAWSGDYSNFGFSVHPTFFGDVFANFYWYGILFAVILVILSNFFDKIISLQKPLLKEMFIFVLANMFVLWGRGSVYNAAFESLMSLIYIFLISNVSRFTMKEIK